MKREERLVKKGWEIWASTRDEEIGDETFIAMDPHGFISVLHFYENGDGERFVDQYLEGSLAEDIEVINESPESYLERFDVINGAPDWYGPEHKWWKL